MTRGRAKIAMGQGVSAWLLEARDGFGDADFHAHHALQITICLDGALTLATTETSLSGRVLAVAADTSHRFQAHGLLAFIFVEPESAAGRTISAKHFRQSPLAVIDHSGFLEAMEPFRHALDHDLASDDMLALAERAIGQLAPINCTRRPDERIQRIIAYASDHLDEPLTLESASKDVFLSGSRLRHLFVEQTGLAFRTYFLWLRLVRALQLYSQGKSLTESAHGAGFADSAHFSRIFKRTFGLPATTLTRL
jgi:AraC-like DNA-binding protein